jgi:hypothetical protein
VASGCRNLPKKLLPLRLFRCAFAVSLDGLEEGEGDTERGDKVVGVSLYGACSDVVGDIAGG